MQYRIVRTDDIEHGLFSKAGAKIGSTWDKHKYIAKEKVGNGYRYFYSQAELAAAKAKKAGQKIAGTAKSGAATVRRAANNAAAGVRQHISKARNYHNSVNDRINAFANSSLKGKTLSKGSPSRAVIDALTSSPKYKYSQAVDKFLSNAEGAISKGKSAVSKIMGDAKSISVTAVDKGKDFCKKVGLAVSDTASRAVGAVVTQVDLAKNAYKERETQASMNDDAKRKKAALDKANAKLAEIEKEQLEKPYKHTDEMWDVHKRFARDDIKRAEYQYNLANRVATQYAPGGKTSYDYFSAKTESGNYNKNIERTSEQRKEDIKLQNLYKYDREYREKVDKERKEVERNYNQLSSQLDTLYEKANKASTQKEHEEYRKKIENAWYQLDRIGDKLIQYEIIADKYNKK